MDELTLTEATADDSEFAYQTRETAFREYVQQAGGWCEEDQRRQHERRVISEARRLGLPIRLRVLKVNNRALAFYQRLGFTPVGETDTHILMEMAAESAAEPDNGNSAAESLRQDDTPQHIEGFPLDLAATTRQTYDALASRFVEDVSGNARLRERMRRFAAMLPGSGPVLDVGSGSCHDSAVLRQIGLDVISVDFSRVCLSPLYGRHDTPGSGRPWIGISEEGVSMTSKGVAAVDRSRIQEIARRLEIELPGWKMHGVLTFGSTARDEAISGSDVDLWFMGHSADLIFLDKTWRQGRFVAGTEGFLAAHPDLEVVDIDSWGDLQTKVGLTMPLVFGSPIADIRWLLWQLAEERDWQCLFFVITGEALVDADGFLSNLQDRSAGGTEGVSPDSAAEPDG